MKIFIIDNSMMTWAWILNVLSRMKGMEITGFSSRVKDALFSISNNNPDIVFINHSMPGKSRFNVIEKIKQINYNITVAVIGDNVPAGSEFKYINAGADYYFDRVREHKLNKSGLLRVVHDLKTKGKTKYYKSSIHYSPEIFQKDLVWSGNYSAAG